MKTYFGNYIGLVIDDADPQRRGRVKVFIPHIMPALYKDWNKEGKDIKFNITGENILTGLNKKKIDALRKILPWAECAAPVFGAGPGGHFNYATGELDAVMLNRGNGEFGQDSQLQKQGAGSGEVVNDFLNGGTVPGIPEGMPDNVNLEPGETLPRESLVKLLGKAATDVYGPGATVEIFDGTAGRDDTERHPDGWAADVKFYDSSGNLVTEDGLAKVVKYWHNNQLGSTGLNWGDNGNIHLDLVGGRFGRALQGNEALWWTYSGSLSEAMRDAVSNVNSSKTGYLNKSKSTNSSEDPYGKADINSKTDPTKETDSIEDEGYESPMDWSDEELVQGESGDVSSSTTEGTASTDSSSVGQTHRIRTTVFGLGTSVGGKDLDEDGYTNKGISSTGTNLGPGVIGSTDSRFQYGDIVQRTNQTTGEKEIYIVAETSTAPQSQGRLDIYTSVDNYDSAYASQPEYEDWTIVGHEDTIGKSYEDIKTQLSKYTEYGNIPDGQSAVEWLTANGKETGTVSTGYSATEAVIAGTQKPIISNPSPYGSAGGPNTNYMPTGMFGNARTGQMVWVFFQEGDPLYPVYFAASYGASEWANINKHSSPDGIKDVDTPAPVQGVQTTMQLVGGGLASKQLISGPEGGNNFEKDEFTFEIFGKNGSNLTFTFHATLLNSKYDFRQHTQADAHYITGGNRTDRTIGDFNTVCEQDVILTVGNWSQDAIEAANNIQGIINQAMKAAKDTYES